MTEAIEETIRKGYHSWRKNPEIGVPYLLAMIITVALSVICLIAVVFVVSVATEFSRNLDPVSSTVATASTLILSGGLSLAIMVAVNAYFSAGAIGMSLEGALRDKTSLSDMAYYGRKKLYAVSKSIFLWIMLLLAPGLILLVPPVFAFYAGAFNVGVVLALLFSLIYLTYAAVVVFLYTLTATAIVADDVGTIKGLMNAYAYAKRNKAKILLIFSAYMGTLYGLSLAFSLITSPLGLLRFYSSNAYAAAEGLLLLAYVFIASFVVAPLYTLWLTRIYVTEPKDAKTGRRQALRPQTREQHAKQREIYV